MTICCAVKKENQLAKPDVFMAMTGALEHYARAGRFWPHLFLAMPDHVHALLSFPLNERMDSVMRDWKRCIVRKAGVKWQDGFFDQRLRSDERFEEKANYIRMNPVRAGLVTRVEAWSHVWPAHAHDSAR